MRLKRYLTALLAAAALLAQSCIKNDIPYPEVEINITGVEGRGFTVASIDVTTRTVTLSLEEQTDMGAVEIDKVTLGVVSHSTSLTNEELLAQVRSSRELTGTFDLRTPLYVTLSLYQSFEWSIVAEQNIERRFSVAGQIGASQFDVPNRTVVANVPQGTDLSALQVNELKLGPADITTYSPTLEELSGTSFETVRFVDVTCFGQTERWILHVVPVDVTVMLTQVDAWSKVIWLYGAGVEGRKMGFRYRVKGSEEWLEVPDVEVDGGSFKARLKAEAETDYEVVAYADDDLSEPRSVRTEATWTLPNGGFEEWTAPDLNITPKRKYWLPYLLDGGTPFWDTGNKGSTTLSESDNISIPENDPRPGSTGTRSAHLTSKWVVLKFAAGNLFTGEYFATKGTNGVVGFGRPCGYRPTALHGWVKFKGGKINRVGSVPVGVDIQQGVTDDNGIIYIALGTWTPEKYGVWVDYITRDFYGTNDVPIAVYTGDKSSFFNAQGPDVVGYGEKVMVENIDEWTEFTIPIEYTSTDRVPTHILIVCSSSRWGDYFTGCDKSELWVGDFELIYD